MPKDIALQALTAKSYLPGNNNLTSKFHFTFGVPIRISKAIWN
jgi:hypothetical protein